MIRYVGIDVHKSFSVACFLDRKGKRLDTVQFETTREAIKDFAERKLDKQCRVAFESTTNDWGVVDILLPHVGQLTVSNPRKTKAIAEGRIKTDKVDAYVLAQLLRVDYLPGVWVPDKKTRDLRLLMGRRRSLVQQKTCVKNRIHSMLHHLIIKVPKHDLFCLKGRDWLKKVELPPYGRLAVNSDLRLLVAIEEEVAFIEDELAKLGYAEDNVKLLMTLPGVDVNTSITLLAALGDISRFKSADKAASYIGLSPSTKQSANKCYHGPITKQGSTNARWMMVQAAQHVRRHPGPIGNFYRKLATKKGHNVAVVAAARKLVTYAWHMLKNNEPYRYSQPKPTGVKLTKLRKRVTGKNLRMGTPKGQPRSKNYGTGKQSRILHSISDICAREGLPEPVVFDDLAPGEKKYLRRNKLVTAMRSLHKSSRIPERGTAWKK